MKRFQHELSGVFLKLKDMENLSVLPNMGRRTIILQLFQSAEIAKPTGVPHFSNLLHAVCANMTPYPVCDSVYLGIPHVREAHDCSKYSLRYSSPDE